jgi:transcriptional regulator with XRE-family HTH domain
MNSNSNTALFSELFTTYRKRAGTQEEIGEKIGLHFSNVSKIERNERRPPKLKHIIAFIRACNLTTDQAKQLLEAGNYPTSALNMIKFDPTLYPSTDQETALSRLRGERGFYPTLLLTENGIITGINLLAMVLWSALSLMDIKPDPSKVLGWSVFEIYAGIQNWSRILLPGKTSDFLFTKIIVFRKLEEFLPASAVDAFKKRIDESATLQLIYEHGTADIGKEWTYNLKLRPPDESFFNDTTILEFEGHVERIMEGDSQSGFIVTYQPLKDTIKVMAELHEALINRFGKEEFIQCLGTWSIRKPHRYPFYCPSITLDQLWTIKGSNAMFSRITNTQATNMHVLDYLLSESIRQIMGDDAAHIMALKALQTFLILTRPYQNPDNPYNSSYQSIMNKLSKRQDFRMLIKQYYKSISLNDLKREIRDGEVRYDLTFTSPYRTSFRLFFMSTLHFTNTQTQEYINILLPGNDETKATLILLQLENTFDTEEQKGDRELQHLIWSLAIIRTVKEGLSKSIESNSWDALTAFEKQKDEFTSTLFSNDNQTSYEYLAMQITLTILELLVQVSPESKENIQELIELFFENTPAAQQILSKEEKKIPTAAQASSLGDMNNIWA